MGNVIIRLNFKLYENIYTVKIAYSNEVKDLGCMIWIIRTGKIFAQCFSCDIGKWNNVCKKFGGVQRILADLVKRYENQAPEDKITRQGWIKANVSFGVRVPYARDMPLNQSYGQVGSQGLNDPV